MKELDRKGIKKYLVLLQDFVDNKILAIEFQKQFLHIRRNDYYLMEGLYDEKFSRILSTLFLDIDHYCEPELADYNKINPNHDITAEELYVFAKEALDKLEAL